MFATDLFSAISRRRSVRKYQPGPVSTDLVQKLAGMNGKATALFPNTEFKAHVVLDGNIVQDRIIGGIIGSYGKIKAPHYIIFTAAPVSGQNVDVGYAGEYLTLGCTTLGLGTCWIGGMIKKQLVKDIIPMDPVHQPIALLAFGIPANPRDLDLRSPDELKRKPLAQIVEGDCDRIWIDVFNAVRLAPSAANSQPWRFLQSENGFDLYVAKPSNIISRHFFGAINFVDVGIACCHAEIAAQRFDRPIAFVHRNGPSRAGQEYIISIVIQ